MFNAKKPLAVNVTHTVELPDIKETIDEGLTTVKHMLKTVGIALAIGIPSVVLFAVAANVAGDVITHNLTTPELQ